MGTNQRQKGVMFFRHYARRLSSFPAFLLYIEAYRTGVFFAQMTVIAQSIEIMTNDAAINLHKIRTVLSRESCGFLRVMGDYFLE
ncbi:Uncharacterised protein [Klebsiella pneumoniae]|nr:Uncharacterised protein [Klebsiella pneumoniae]